VCVLAHAAARDAAATTVKITDLDDSKPLTIA
jgi:hypothetical protein